ncbi:ankyrin repeat-containing protein At5g02620 [Brachypodium distachyon]|uniref:PGG domain-containing protein n=1 Tax=Brachypodium distachyon TaxID=15368 RepID=A0A2K2CVR6_BRADI|nr:ankyrin repeat-containing protein At5g02620 [Brachypodium distachyon]PNT66115.1 hypothetical protein BRADI_3g07390v3 [Brachypodium distachyon]|eukprot:XP_014756130.1 ankyrin repeat-containing protein At5g02620 [Brachypodium distachyon]
MSATTTPHQEELQKTQMQSKRDVGFEPRPELLMAARRGDWQQLERLLATPQPVRDVVVDIEIEEDVLTSGEAVTMAGDSVLHVVASSGDGEEILKSATAIHGKSSHLLFARNKKGDTPLHCAARAGRGRMVTHLLALATPARAENGHNDGGKKVKEFLRMQNKRGETALHEAVRLGDKDMVDRLMAEDPELARVPPADGASPLYLAVSLGHDDIARQLHEKDNALSFCGPDGRTALHAAVLKSKETTKMLLEWNKDLIKQAERSTGSTALHFAASSERAAGPIISLLLAAGPSLAYQPDNNGSFPIHVAAIADRGNALYTLLHGCHDCAELRDAKGGTFLHVAVVEESSWGVIEALNDDVSFIGNMQDNDGNTALHLAVQHERAGIHDRLRDVGATFGTCRRDSVDKRMRLNEKEEAQKITEAAQTVGLGSALIATVAFAAAFTLPGGYRADDHENGGSPTLAGHYAFDAFIIADTLAFVLSILSIGFLISAGVVPMNLRPRLFSLTCAKILMVSSARSLCAAFAFGLYVELAPVARTTAIASCAITALAFLDTAWSIMRIIPTVMVLVGRGVRLWSWTGLVILTELLWPFWSYIVIAGLCFRIKRVH